MNSGLAVSFASLSRTVLRGCCCAICMQFSNIRVLLFWLTPRQTDDNYDRLYGLRCATSAGQSRLIVSFNKLCFHTHLLFNRPCISLLLLSFKQGEREGTWSEKCSSWYGNDHYHIRRMLEIVSLGKIFVIEFFRVPRIAKVTTIFDSNCSDKLYFRGTFFLLHNTIIQVVGFRLFSTFQSG